jgi:O-antigen ligase
MNLMSVLVAASWVYRSSSPARRRLLPLLAIPVGYVYLLSQRRAAVVGLVCVAALGAILLFWNNRRRFWRVIPVVLLVATAYVGAFWNVEGGAGFPAQAVKTVVSPNDVSESDRSSDIYRVVENIDLLATIKTRPLTGIGFGTQFYRPLELPDISVFEFWEYIPHNSIMSMWMKTGIFGFLSMLAVFGVAVRTGASTLRRVGSGDDAAMTFAALGFVIMFATFAYVDIAWDPRSMIYLALMLGLLSTMQRTAPTESESTE